MKKRIEELKNQVKDLEEKIDFLFELLKVEKHTNRYSDRYWYNSDIITKLEKRIEYLDKDDSTR